MMARFGIPEALRKQALEADEVGDFHRAAIQTTWTTTLQVADSDETVDEPS